MLLLYQNILYRIILSEELDLACESYIGYALHSKALKLVVWFTVFIYAVSRDSIVGTVTCLRAERLRKRSSITFMGKLFFVLPSFLTDSGVTQPPIQWAQLALSEGVSQPEREVYHSPIIAEVKSERNCTSASHMPSCGAQEQIT
jgi:hypothetical protein